MHSLIQTDAQQPALLDTSEWRPRQFTKSKGRPDYTAEWVYKHRPDDYKKCITMLAAKIGINRIAKRLGMNNYTVMSIRDNEPFELQREQTRLAGKNFFIADLYAEAEIEALLDPQRRKKMTPRDLAVGKNIAIEGGQLLAGEATTRTESIEQIRVSPHDALNAYLDTMKNITPAPLELPPAP